jgi:hypothetical protein
MANPDTYMGKTVAVGGEVQEVFGPSAFKLDEH